MPAPAGGRRIGDRASRPAWPGSGPEQSVGPAGSQVVDTYRYAGASESVVEIATGGGKPHRDSNSARTGTAHQLVAGFHLH